MQTSLILFIFALIQNVQLKEDNPQLKIKQGILKGSLRKTWGGRSFLAFQGIPYAQPPVGNRRFKSPLPAGPWEGVLDATKNHESCPQRQIFFNNMTIFGNEDCLYLNVYTPQITETQLLPVIIYIHGGGFMTDSANPNLYGPDIMLDKDVVLVTLNYRLGALGFLSLEDEVLPGNYGLKDQNLAIKWAKSNIASFGGNPNKVTIFGNSAGGASVYFQLLSPLSKGLFHAAISSSGIATAPWALAEKGAARQNAEKLAEFLNCPVTSSNDILKCLQDADSFDIVRQYDKFMELKGDPGIPHPPVIEPKIPGAFLTKHPLDVIKSREFEQVPYMNGITTDDGGSKSASFFGNEVFMEQLNEHFNHVAPVTFHYEHHDSKEEILKSVMQFYFQGYHIDHNHKSQLTDAITDALFYYPQRITSQLQSKYSNQPVYFYLFGYKGSVSNSNFYNDTEHDYGVVHCDDLTYTLSNDIFQNYTPTETDLKMNEIMTSLVYNFAATGNPTPEINSIISSKWEPLRSNSFKYYAIMGPDSIRTEENLREERYQFWKELGFFRKFDNVKDEL